MPFKDIGINLSRGINVTTQVWRQILHRGIWVNRFNQGGCTLCGNLIGFFQDREAYCLTRSNFSQGRCSASNTINIHDNSPYLYVYVIVTELEFFSICLSFFKTFDFAQQQSTMPIYFLADLNQTVTNGLVKPAAAIDHKQAQ